MNPPIRAQLQKARSQSPERDTALALRALQPPTVDRDIEIRQEDLRGRRDGRRSLLGRKTRPRAQQKRYWNC